MWLERAGRETEASSLSKTRAASHRPANPHPPPSPLPPSSLLPSPLLLSFVTPAVSTRVNPSAEPLEVLSARVSRAGRQTHVRAQRDPSGGSRPGAPRSGPLSPVRLCRQGKAWPAWQICRPDLLHRARALSGQIRGRLGYTVISNIAWQGQDRASCPVARGVADLVLATLSFLSPLQLDF